MELRWISLALVLALVAGHAARATPPPTIHGEQSDALDGARLPPAHAQRSQKRLDAPRRDARRASHERPPALLPALPAAPRLIRVAVVEPLAAPSGRGRPAGPIAVARAPPGA
jgi:hypothetical protein